MTYSPLRLVVTRHFRHPTLNSSGLDEKMSLRSDVPNSGYLVRSSSYFSLSFSLSRHSLAVFAITSSDTAGTSLTTQFADVVFFVDDSSVSLCFSVGAFHK